tara:strand:- start:57 stop:464 length:408 start_codon:yes stop_codon:yes gene_type:complete
MTRYTEKSIKKEIRKLQYRKDRPEKQIRDLQRKLRTIKKISKIKNKHTRQFPINKLSYQENKDVPLTTRSSRKTKKVKKKRGFFNFLRIPNFRRKTQKSRSLLSRLSQSVTGLSKKIPQTTRTTEIVPKIVPKMV